jgi:hypothetical protein
LDENVEPIIDCSTSGLKVFQKSFTANNNW